MSTDAETEAEPVKDRRERWSMWAWIAAVVFMLLITVIGAGMMRGWFSFGSQQTADADDEEGKKEKKEKEEKQKKEVEILFPVVQPAEPEAPLSYAKPGHWATATQTMRANIKDFVGDSQTVITNSRRVPYTVRNTPFVLRGSRPILLTKGQPKSTENTIFIPQTNEAMRLSVALEERGLGRSIPALETPISAMPSYQYYMVVLAKQPVRYSFLKTIDSVAVPFGGEHDFDEVRRNLHYRVVMIDVKRDIPLSENPLTWTSIAYILWDEIDPKAFSPDQERALIDWLHWGGQLVINGPDSIDTLKDSFLAPYLPADGGGARQIAADDAAFEELNDEGEGWLVSTQKTPGEAIKPLQPWAGVNLVLRKDSSAAEVPGTGGLLVERRVGLGRIVMSAMQLSERELINWRSGFENLINGAILRRPGREYRPGALGPATLMWHREDLSERRLDARLVTNVRYFARDLGVETAYRREENRQEVNNFGQQEVFHEYVAPSDTGGLGAWNDFNLTADSARDALREAAGVEVPNSNFVVLSLAAYLVALVPLNWLIFRTIGRVEWAWIAAPLIAIVSTFVVVNQAQLDIGFVRAQTEIGVVEQQPNYARAHLSRYTALYTSLSTTYNLDFANMTTLAAPFPTSSDFQMMIGQSSPSVDFQRYDNVRLRGLPVSSNSTGMVHSEQMTDLGGPIVLTGAANAGSNQIENRTKFNLRSACVVRREGNRLAGHWIGELPAGRTVPLSMNRNIDLEKPYMAERATEQNSQIKEPLNLEGLFQLALNHNYIENGETRLVARVDEVLEGETISPAASQVRGATIVVAHLDYAKLPPPERDLNTKQDVKGAPEIEIELNGEPEDGED